MGMLHLDVCLITQPLHVHLGGVLSLLGFAHLVVGLPFQVQVRCRRFICIRDRTYEESQIVALIYIL